MLLEYWPIQACIVQEPHAMTLVLLLVATILCTSLAQVLQKRLSLCLSQGSLQPCGSSDSKSHDQTDTFEYSNTAAALNRFKLGLLFIHSVSWLALGLVLWFFVLGRMEVSIAYPMLSLNVVVVMFLSTVVFGEKISFHQVVGAVAIISGVVLLTSGSIGSSIS